jgi:hypothetical protein
MLSGCAMEQGGEAVWEICKYTSKLEAGQQGVRRHQAGNLGRDAGNKRFKPAPDHLGVHHATKESAS